MKSVNVAMNLSIPKDLKDEFSKIAYGLWTNPTNLLKMLMKQTITTRQINFSISTFEDIEIEPLDTNDWWDDFNKKSFELTKKMSSLLKSKKWA